MPVCTVCPNAHCISHKMALHVLDLVDFCHIFGFRLENVSYLHLSCQGE